MFAGALVPAQADVDFAKDILPILEQSCVKCHGAEKQKGKLRLDTREAALKGGKGGPAFTPKDAAKSELYRRITLPKGDDDVMPNEGDPLTKAQADLIKDWINQGANWPEGAAPKESAGTSTPAKPAAPAVPTPELPKDFKPPADEAKVIAKLAESGTELRPIAMNSPWRDANFRLQGTSVTDTVIAPLKNVTSLVDLNLATTKITDAGLDHIKNLPHLQRLHLELTAVTDTGLAKLKGLSNLTYLNLYGTAVTDAGLEHLRGLKYLRNLYVWQTKVTDAGVASLKKSLPGVDVSTGWDLKDLPKKEEKPEEKKDSKKEDKQK